MRDALVNCGVEFTLPGCVVSGRGVPAATLTPAQCREARTLLGWSRCQLAAASGLGEYAVVTYELYGRMPDAKRGLNGAVRMQVIRATLEAAGVELTNGEAPGVRRRRC
jgi:hypothetical protein